LVSSGKIALEIGKILKIREFDVKNHMQRIFKELDLSDRTQPVGLFKTLVSNG